MITAICQECDKQFEYDLKPGYPRKYCPECSAIKKASFEAKNTNVTQTEDKVETQKIPAVSSNKHQYPKDPVGLAVDIFCTMIEGKHSSDNFTADMEVSIKLVKQAKEAFE